jgi:hypothetical protein
MELAVTLSALPIHRANGTCKLHALCAPWLADPFGTVADVYAGVVDHGVGFQCLLRLGFGVRLDVRVKISTPV